MSQWSVEIASSGRAGCKGLCKEKIAKGELRWCKQAETSFGMMKSYMHLNCLKYPVRAGLEWEDIGGLDEFSADQVSEIKAAYEHAKANTGKSKKKKKPAASPKKRGAADGDENSSPPKKKKAKTSTKKRVTGDGDFVDGDEDPIVQKYSSLTLGVLKEHLRLNKQKLTGVKKELVARCVDGEKKGRILACPLCAKGRPCFMVEKEVVQCNGYFDDDISMRISCNWEAPADSDKVPRDRWLILGQDEAPNDDEDGATNPNGKGSSASVSEDDVQKVVEKFDELGESPSAKDVAAMLVKTARQMGVNLPAEDATARRTVGTVLMSHRNDDSFDIVGAYKQLVSEQGTVAEAKAAEKRKEAAQPKAAVAANSDLATALDELATLEGKAKDGANFQFKVRSLKKAVGAIRACEFEITSGKQVSSGKQKLPGVGKGTAKAIDEFLANGKFERTEELKSKLE